MRKHDGIVNDYFRWYDDIGAENGYRGVQLTLVIEQRFTLDFCEWLVWVGIHGCTYIGYIAL